MNTSDTSTSDTNTGRTSPRRRATALGVGAGVVGGGLVGLLMTVPGLTSAASQDSTDDSPPAVVSVQDADADESRPAPGTRLREQLQPLVDDGTITAAQADAVTAHLAENRPERDGHQKGARRGFDGDVVAGLLGMDAEELRDALRNGATIAELAEANGVDVQTVIDTLVAEAEQHLDLAVEAGRLTEEEAAEKLAGLADKITSLVNGERPARG